MRKPITLILAASALSASLASPGSAGPLRDRLRARMAERMMESGKAADANAPETKPSATISYGKAAEQNLDYWQAPNLSGADSPPAPLIVFVHGGGWKRGSKDRATGKWKPAHFGAEGYNFASINYRLVPDATVEQQAADVASALNTLLALADKLHIDRRRVVLMGHSAGAHLVALVGTDERYLKGAGLSFSALAGVVPIDGAAYDIPAQMNDGPRMMQQTYALAFGADPARQNALSPTMQAAVPNAARFLLLHVQRPDGVRQSEGLEKALKAGGSQVERDGFAGEGLIGHMEINRRLGDPDYAATGALDKWLKGVFGG